MSTQAVNASIYSEALLASMKATFPAWHEIDYASLLKRDFRDALVDLNLVQDVEQVLGLIDVLLAQDLVEADYYQDGDRRFYSKVRFTFEGWDRVKTAKGGLVSRVLTAPSEGK